jgi:hypothetical protein
MSKLDKSEQNRAIRKDSLEAKYGSEKLEKIINELYVDRRLSTTNMPKVLEEEFGIQASASKCYRLVKKLGITKSISESVSDAKSTLDYQQSLMTKDFQYILDGLNIGDGTIEPNHNTKVARLGFASIYEEFINYVNNLMKTYNPPPPKFSGKDRSDIKKGKGAWYNYTKFHPDIYKQYQRWSPNGIKDVPADIELTPITVLLWYLGDGSLSSRRESNSRTCYFSTNSFSREAIENILVPKLLEIGVKTKRITDDNRLYIATESIVTLLNYMGGKSPVRCYDYKFDIEEWRLWTPLADVAKMVGLAQDRLQYYCRINRVSYSKSPRKGKRLFTENQIALLKEQIATGKIKLEKGKTSK